MARLRQRLRRTAAAVSAALMLTAVPMPALTASAAEPVLRMNLIGGGSVIGIGWQLEAPDGLSGYSVTLDGKKVRPEADGTFSSYDYAMDMTKPHTVTVSKGGRQVLKKEASVCSYLNSLLADSTYSGYFPVAEAMLIYGGAAQEYFGADTEHPASEGIDSTAALNREIPESGLQKGFLECLERFDVDEYPVTYTGMNLAVQSELRFSLFFETKPGCTAEAAEAYLRLWSFGGEPAEITPYGENGWRMSRTVNVKDLCKVFELMEPDADCWSVSPLQYLNLAEETGDEALIRVCKALYNYAIVAKRAASPIRSIELKKDYFCDWTVGEDHAYMWDPNDLQNLMLGEDGKKKYERSVPEQLCLERTDKTGQTLKIPVQNMSTEKIGNNDNWWDSAYTAKWLKQSDYEEAEAFLCSNSECMDRVSAKVELDEEKDVLLLFVTLGEPVGEFALQNLQLDADENLTVSSSFLQETDYSDGDVIWAYRLEFPKGTLSGEYIPEDSGEQQPEDDAVIRDIGLDTEYYYDLEKMNENSLWTSVEPDAEMLAKDPEAFRASLPETLVIEKTDGTGKTVQIPVLKQDRAADEAWRIWGRNDPAPDWLKKEDYKAAEKALCDPMVGMQRVSARLEQGDDTDVLLLYFTWNFMDGELELRNLKFDANGKLTVGVSFCRTTEYGWGSDIYAYRLTLPHGAFSFDAGGSGGDETEPAVTTATESVSETTETTAVTEETDAQPPIRSIEMKTDHFWDWTVGEDHAYMWDPNDLQNLMLGEDGKKKYERSVPEQLCLERTDKAGQTVKIPVRGRKFSGIEIDPGDDWNDMPEWLKRSDYEEAEKLLSSNSENWEYWSHVSAKYEQDDEKDVLLLFVTLYELAGSSALQSLQLDENGKLTVNTSYLEQADYAEGEYVDAYRLEFPKGTLSGEYIPENDGGQQPEDDAVIRDIGLDTEYYYDLEKMYDCGSGMFDEADPDSEMLVRDPEAFRASLPETLVIEKTDGTGKTVQIPVLKQDRAADEAWRIWGRNDPAPDWLKKEDYKAAEKALCDPMFGMQRVSARLEQGEETDVLLLYFTWNFMSGDLGIRNLKFDANGKLTVGVSFCRTTEYGWGPDIYAYRLELPHGAL